MIDKEHLAGLLIEAAELLDDEVLNEGYKKSERYKKLMNNYKSNYKKEHENDRFVDTENGTYVRKRISDNKINKMTRLEK